MLYLADSPVTALDEVEVLLRTNRDLRGVRGPPRIVLSVECALQRVLGLNDETLRTLGLTVEEVTAPWREHLRHDQRPVTHDIGQVSFERGDVEALLVPSAKNPAALNLVVFPDRLVEGGSLRAFDDSGMIDARLP